MKSRLLLSAALAALVALPAMATAEAPGHSAARRPAPVIDIRPAELAKGAAPSIAQLVGRTVIDGDIRVKVPARTFFLGKSGTSYVVAGAGRVLRLDADGTKTRIADAADDDALPRLSRDGVHVITARYGRQGRTRVLVVDATTGATIAQRTFAKYASVLDADEGRLVLSSWSPARTQWWNYLSDTVSTISNRTGGRADIRADRLSTFTGDPYEGGCTVVTSLRHPTKTLWRSCEEAVAAFAPDGSRMATAHILADGLGPNQIRVRTTRGGAKIATYAAYWFGNVEFETNDALLLDAHTKTRAALVRCVDEDCNRASPVRHSRTP
jgi:hypothetical protein